MKSLRRSLAVVAGTASLVALGAQAALAQESIDPSTTPEKNISGTGPITPFGLHISLAFLMLLLGVAVVIVTVILYMRYAPRFARDEESLKVVRADRVVIGEDLPRRNVDLSQAAPVVVAPPAIPAVATASAAPAPAAAAPAPAAAAPTAAAPVSAAGASSTPAAAAEAAPAPAAAAPAPAAPAPPAERVEVTLDQAVYESTLAELLAAGTDRRIAEGKAKRAGMIAAKKAAGAS